MAAFVLQIEVHHDWDACIVSEFGQILTFFAEQDQNIYVDFDARIMLLNFLQLVKQEQVFSQVFSFCDDGIFPHVATVEDKKFTPLVLREELVHHFFVQNVEVDENVFVELFEVVHEVFFEVFLDV
jgi:hypothetical protein